MIDSEQLNILLVDDNDIDIAVNTKLLKLAEFTENIYSFNSCKQCLAFINDNSRGLKKKTNVVLLDIMMPGLNGFECLVKFDELADEVKKSFYIFMLSSSIDRNDIQRAESSNLVRKVLEKPLDVYQLKRLLTELAGELS